MIPATYHPTHDRTLPPPDQGNGLLSLSFLDFFSFFSFVCLIYLFTFWEGVVGISTY